MRSVGEILKKNRLEKNISLDDVEKATKIRKKFLAQIEENNWYFSSRVYVEGIVKNYARFLGLNHQKVIAFFRRDYENKDEINFRKKRSSSFLDVDREKMFKIIFFVTFFMVLIYFGYQLKKYLTPPKIVILSPKKTTFVNEEKIRIVGETLPGSEINIFGNKIYPDKQGRFNFDLPLTKEKNQVVIEVTGPNGKKSQIEKIFYLKK
jgi:transcriptional regulator with XRE-family HTH domain